MLAKLTLSASVLVGVAVVSLPAQNSSKRIGAGPTQSSQAPARGNAPLLQSGAGKPTPFTPKLPFPGNNAKPTTPKTTPNPMGSSTNPANPFGKILTNPNIKAPGTTTQQSTSTSRLPLPGNDKLKLPNGDKLKLGDLKLGNKGPLGPFSPNPNVRRNPVKPTPNNNNANLGSLLNNRGVGDFLKNGGQRRNNHGQFDVPFNVGSRLGAKTPKAPSNEIKGFARSSAKSVENKYKDKLTPNQQSALNNFQTHGTWTPQDRAVVSNLVYTNSAGMTNQELASLSKALMVDRMLLNEDDESPVNAGQIATSPSQIRVVNRTGEKLKLWVQYRNAAQPPSPEWNPMVQNELSALEYSLDPGDDDEGKAFDLRVAGKNLTAYSIHYWAMTPTEQWADYMEQELVLTPDASNIYELAFAR